jgi:Gas vesicle synthesis protein GvpL/GvpF
VGGSRRVPLATTSPNTYLYCVVRSVKRPSMPRAAQRLPGGGVPRAIEVARGRWLVVAAVPSVEFGQRALDARLKDLDWVSRCGVAHQSVVEHFLRTPSAAIVPMALFTIFDNDARALEEVRRDTARLDASLDRVAGRGEWVVRVLRGEPAATTKTRTASAAATATLTRGDGTSGRAFLQAKADQRLAAKRAAQEADAAVHALAQALTDVADEVSTHTDAPGIGSTAVLDAAFLVARSDEAAFEREARRFAQPLTERGFRVSVTGPWPCYSFVAGRPPS